MKLDFSEENINLSFEITEDNKVALKSLSVTPDCIENEKNLKWCPISEIHLTGENPDDHHGAKHTGTSGGKSLEYVSHNYYKNSSGNKLEFLLSDGKIEVTVHYQFYTKISAVRTWTTVTNISKTPIGLEYVSSFTYTGLENNEPKVFLPHNTWVREANWKQYSLEELGLDRNSKFSLKRISVSNTGTWSAKEYLPMGAFSGTAMTLMWQIENNGSWQWEISDISDMLYLKISGPNEQENHWYKELSPAESFESVKVCISVGTDFNTALEEMTKYRRQIFENNVPNSVLPIIFNDYMNCLWGDPTTEKMFPVIDKAAEAGAEYYCMDAGWYADGSWWETVGEWKPCGWRFPNGIEEVFDYIKSKGMIPGIWLEIEVMGISCPILDQFEDECFFMRHGKKIIDHGRYQLDFRNAKVRKYATDVISRIVEDYGVGYIKMDYNIEAGMGTEVGADSFGDGLLEHNRAYLSWIDAIKARYPDLIIENCSSGGMRMDYAMLAKHHLQSVSDQEDYRHTAYIAAAVPTAVLPEQAAIWSYPCDTDDDNAVIFNMTGALMQRMHLSGQLPSLTEERFSLVKDGVECYKKIRGDIAAAIPFYPIGIPKYGDDWLCLAFRCKTCVRISVWRMNSDKDSINIPLDFNISDVNVLYPTKTDFKVCREKDGVCVTLPQKYSSVLFQINS